MSDKLELVDADLSSLVGESGSDLSQQLKLSSAKISYEVWFGIIRGTEIFGFGVTLEEATQSAIIQLRRVLLYFE